MGIGGARGSSAALIAQVFVVAKMTCHKFAMARRQQSCDARFGESLSSRQVPFEPDVMADWTRKLRGESVTLKHTPASMHLHHRAQQWPESLI